MERMTRRYFLYCFTAPLFLSGSIKQQEPPPVPPAPDAAAPKPQFFAGLVIEADHDHVKVSRSLVGRPPETRVFVIDEKTKTPKGGIKPKARVTVRFEQQADRYVALEIQVRPTGHNPKTV